MEKEYRGMMQKHEWACPKNHIFRTKPHSISLGKGCPHPECNIRARKTITDMHNTGERTGLIFLDEEYRGMMEKHRWKCNVGHEFLSRPNNISNMGQGCPFCFQIRNRTYKTRTERKLADRLRVGLANAVSRNYRTGSAVRDLGCSISELKVYLEQRFTRGMTWENWGCGAGKWSIDHILPMASFDLTKREELLKCCNYTNLQPMWSPENSAKGDRLDWPSR